MTKTGQKVTSPIGRKFKENRTMTADAGHRVGNVNTEIQNSIVRGNLLRYALYMDCVKENLDSLKKSNPKYLPLIDRIIQTSITPLPALDVDVPLGKILNKINEASYNNCEALDFTQEVLKRADILTSKYYLAHLSGSILENKDVKKQFKASIPFVKYILASLKKTSDISAQSDFMNAVKILINPKADAEKIALLPKLKYIADSDKKNNHTIDVTKIIYSKTPVQELLHSFESNYLTQN